MQVSRRLMLGAMVPALMAVALAFALAASYVTVSGLQMQQEGITAITGDLSELSDLARSYINTHEQRPRAQFRAKHDELSRRLEEPVLTSSAHRGEIEEIARDVEIARSLFEGTVRNHEQRYSVPPKVAQEAEDRLSGQLFIRLRETNGQAASLASAISNDILATQRRIYIALATSMILAATALTAGLLLLRASIIQSLALLKTGTETIGAGNLEHRIGLDTPDELGDLARSFDRMTDDLHRVTVSRNELEAEVHERERLQQELKQELETTRLLLDAAGNLGAWTDLDGLLHSLADTVLGVTNHLRATICIWDERLEELTTVCSVGEDPVPRETLPFDRLSQGFREVLRRATSGLVDYDAPGASAGGTPDLHGSHLALLIPMYHRGRIVGVIAIDDPGRRCEFSDREIELAEGVAAQAAVAVENARLYATEHRVAETLQEALLALPGELPGVDFAHAYHSATEAARVGGDFYDVFEIEHGLVGVTIGDVAGKGLDAAVLTSLVKNAIRVHAQEKGAMTSRILDLTNDVVFRVTPGEAFVTVFFGVLNRERGTLTYSSAGHTTGAIVRSDGSVRTLPATGPILGAFDHVDFAEAEERVGPDELMFLYTDGLTEARQGGEMFGDEGVFRMLATFGGAAPSDAVSRMMDEVLSFTRGSLSDDLAMLATRRLPT